MTIRSRLGRWLIGNQWDSSAVKKGSFAWNELFGASSPLPVPNERTALTISAIYACVNLISGVIASLPVSNYRVDKKGYREEIWGDDLWWVLNEQFTPRWSAAPAWEFMSASLLLLGNAYAEIKRDGSGNVVGLSPIHPRRVEIVLDGTRDALIYRVAHDENDTALKAGKSTSRIVDQDDMIHVPGFGFDGVKGISPLQYALKFSGSVAMATQEFSANFFANSARPDYLLRTDQSLKAETVDRLRDQLNDRHQGPANAHKPMVLDGGLDVKMLSMPIEDLQLIQVRQFQVEEIARVFGVPPFMIGHNEKTTSWGSGVEAMGIGFVRYTLRPYLTKFENELNRKLIRRSPKYLAFDTAELERADMKSFYEGLRSGVGRAGERQLISVNEARKQLRQKPVEGGDNVETSALRPVVSSENLEDKPDA